MLSEFLKNCDPQFKNSLAYLTFRSSNIFFGDRFRPNQFTVRVGEWDLSDNDNYVQEFRVVDIQAHPDFKPNGFYNDVALFVLDQPVRFTE
jgi:hypothetical protein